MADLVPQPFSHLLRRLAHELTLGAAFDLPARSFHRPPPGLDFSVAFHGERAANCLGPAAGPQSQLAQNLVLSYLAGGRVMELKTVQVNDALQIPRPCIDAANVGYNVEWSQELRLAQSLEEYVKGWVLLHALRHAGLGLTLGAAFGDFVFDLSVGYDLDGIRSDGVRRFLDGMLDARALIDALFEAWPKDLLAWRPPREAVPNQLSSCVTLSTFHGCPADEIERICEHLLGDVGTHVIAKLNPTLLGYAQVTELLHQRLGYAQIRPHRDSFDSDLQWDEALGLCRRLGASAQSKGRFFGAKFSNTLVVENHRSFFPASEKLMYLSGQPLHALSFELALRFREAFGAPLPISFSAGVDSRNFADCVAAGFTPVTTCTDLLRPGGYGRLPRYLDALATRMRQKGATNVEGFILAEAGLEGPSTPERLHQAALVNHRAAAARVREDPRYGQAANAAVPRRLGTKLWFFDCVSCDKCVQVCPNDANFTLTLPEPLRAPVQLPDLVVSGGALKAGQARTFALTRPHQIGNYADFCNECGNCDVFCPEEGGPYLVKPRFFASRENMESAPADREGFAVEQAGSERRIVGRHLGRRLSLSLDVGGQTACFHDDQVEVELAYPSFERWTLRSVREGTPEGHVVRLDLARALAALLEGVFAPGAMSPVVAPYLAARPPPSD